MTSPRASSTTRPSRSCRSSRMAPTSPCIVRTSSPVAMSTCPLLHEVAELKESPPPARSSSELVGRTPKNQSGMGDLTTALRHAHVSIVDNVELVARPPSGLRRSQGKRSLAHECLSWPSWVGGCPVPFPSEGVDYSCCCLATHYLELGARPHQGLGSQSTMGAHTRAAKWGRAGSPSPHPVAVPPPQASTGWCRGPEVPTCLHRHGPHMLDSLVVVICL